MPTKAWLVGLLCVLGLAAPAAADEWSHKYAVKGRPDVHLKTDDGAVRVETGAASDVEAVVTTRGWRIGGGEVTVTESQTGDRVSIEVRVPRMQHFGVGHRSVELVVRMPREADLDVKTGDGGMDIEPVSGKVSLFTGDGHITARGLRGEMRLHSGDGSIKADALDGRLQADTGDGAMDVRGRFDALDLRTGDGHIDASAERGSKVGAAWSLSSGDGGIVLRVPDDLAADVEAHTGDGHIDLGAGVTVSGRVSRNEVHGKLGAGGAPLRLHTGDGSIRLQN
jgi:hypothetical protein